MESALPLEVLQQYWGFQAFRPRQADIIQSVLDEKDTLALLPTGGGKSVCFQVPALCKPGMALVISPLIALMKDQVERLNQLGIAATFINSSMSKRMIDTKLEAAMQGAYRFLYLAPERIQSEIFRLRLPNMPVNLLVVDEAHCISQWGYDFRPAYLNIHQIRETLPQIPVIALTASATPQVEQDIADKLQMRQPALFRQTFRRENLRYFVLKEENVAHRILEIARRTQGTGIIYARTRKATEQLAEMLRKHEIPAAAYHGGMKTSERDEVQSAWLQDDVRIMVATNAFGMGIDKPDVRFVLHYHLPFDLESYYQEAGRGGRDGKTALAIAFDNAIDRAEMERWSKQKYPTWETLQHHYHQLCNFFRVPNSGSVGEQHLLDMKALAKETGISPLPLYQSMRLLHNEGLLFLSEDSDDFAYLQVLADPQALMIYKQQHPDQAEFIDFMLRTLGGESFTREVRFLPIHWSRNRGMTEAAFEQTLDRLAQYKMIRWQKPLSQPTIRFLKPRQALNQKVLNWDKYTFLREQAAHRLKQIIDYVEEDKVCRSLLIQHYFGEKDHTPCGKCDVCIGRHKTRVSDNEFDQIREALLEYLSQGPRSYRDAIQKVQAGGPAQREKVLRYLLDKELILADIQGMLRLA